LNFLTKKDSYPLPFIDEIMDSVTSKELYSFLDGFNGYNQVKIRAHDREKTAFITKWGGIYIHGNALWVMQCPDHLPMSYH
jgi:hypothetical protein